MTIAHRVILIFAATTFVLGVQRMSSGVGELRAAQTAGLGEARLQGRNTPTPAPGPNGITYHGGPVMTSSSGTNLYYIWYGNWSGNTGPAILEDLAKNLGGSAYFNINTTYFDASNVHVTNAVNFLGSASDAYSQGTTLSNAQIRAVVSKAITDGLRLDTNAVYMVLTSQDVVPSNFCNGSCGGYGHFMMGSTDIKYGFVPNAARCPNACAPAQPTTGPNGNVGADAMASTISHELINAITNSNGAGWHDSSGRAPASICATPQTAFPVTYVAPNGALASVKLGTRDYLIQTTWVNANGGYCAMSMRNRVEERLLLPNLRMEPTRRSPRATLSPRRAAHSWR